MDNNGNQVTICGKSAFGRALRLLLDGFEVELVGHPTERRTDPNVLVWQVNGAVDGVELSEVASSVATLVLADESQLIRAVDTGCRGFLPMTAPLDQVREAVETIVGGGAVVPPELLGTLLRHLVQRRRRDTAASDALEGLTEREREVFQLAALGARKEEIGKRLFISPATARTHLQRVYRKLGVHSQSELMALAMRIGAVLEESQ